MADTDTNIAGDRFDTMAAELLAKHSVCGDIAAHDMANLQQEIAGLLRATAPFANEAKFQSHGVEHNPSKRVGPGYLTKRDWKALQEAYRRAGGETT